MSEANPPYAKVYRSGEPVGLLSRANRVTTFRYLPGATRAVGYRMPLRDQPYEVSSENLHPLFAGMIPEGSRMKALAKRLVTKDDDWFTLFIGSCGNAIGDISIRPAGEETALVDLRNPERLDFIRIAEQLNQGTLIDPTSLAGVQTKASAAHLTPRRRVSSRPMILKFPDPAYPRIVENEAYFMRLAAKCRIRVPRVEVVQDRNSTTALAVPRFDRVYHRGDQHVRVHVEDACQFMDLYPNERYKLTVRRIAEGIAELASAPSVAVLEWLRIVLFSYLIGNSDLHGKNVSLWTEPRSGLVELAPAYDLLCTVAFAELEPTMAIQMEGKLDQLLPSDFLRLGKDLGVPERAIQLMMREVLEGVYRGLGDVDSIGWDRIARTRASIILSSRLESFGAALSEPALSAA